ncbi:hypothetical protein AYI69_g5 [Smittium culicis]|uniref:Uncharacterized protein n=1 Tax=Smittium culicis TaxID=133412 RepID=A0A1R1YUB6_9FUNG|nr:hypothetical protein AYI69_g5 [Smittium culicis]
MLCSIFAPFDARFGSLFKFSNPPINGTPFDSRSNVDNEHTYPTLSEYVLNTRKNSIIWLEVFAMLPITGKILKTLASHGSIHAGCIISSSIFAPTFCVLAFAFLLGCIVRHDATTVPKIPI